MSEWALSVAQVLFKDSMGETGGSTAQLAQNTTAKAVVGLDGCM